jgi:hypothetical protein
LAVVRSDEATPRRFVGTVSPRQLRWALAVEYPWLERAWANAYAEVPQVEIHSVQGALDVQSAIELIRAFLANLQRQDPPLVEESREWVQVSSSTTWEHAEWLSADLKGTLRTILNGASVSEPAGGSESAFARAVLAHQGAAFVAILGATNEFRRLVDRQALLEQAAARLSQTSVVIEPLQGLD